MRNRAHVFSQSYALYFLEGTNNYRRKEWSDVARRMETALERYLEAEERCRFACEKSFDMGWHPDYVSAISSEEGEEKNIISCISTTLSNGYFFKYCRHIY